MLDSGFSKNEIRHLVFRTRLRSDRQNRNYAAASFWTSGFWENDKKSAQVFASKKVKVKNKK